MTEFDNLINVLKEYDKQKEIFDNEISLIDSEYDNAVGKYKNESDVSDQKYKDYRNKIYHSFIYSIGFVIIIELLLFFSIISFTSINKTYKKNFRQKNIQGFCI